MGTPGTCWSPNLAEWKFIFKNKLDSNYRRLQMLSFGLPVHTRVHTCTHMYTHMQMHQCHAEYWIWTTLKPVNLFLQSDGVVRMLSLHTTHGGHSLPLPKCFPHLLPFSTQINPFYFSKGPFKTCVQHQAFSRYPTQHVFIFLQLEQTV